MELLRLIRLEQVNFHLRCSELREELNLKKVGDIANHFGFSSRGHFSAAYQNHFDETPRQTLSKANHQQAIDIKTWTWAEWWSNAAMSAH